VCGLLSCVGWWMNSDVSEEHAATLFMTEVTSTQRLHRVTTRSLLFEILQKVLGRTNGLPSFHMTLIAYKTKKLDGAQTQTARSSHKPHKPKK
jgi:hypothetical protein